MNKETFTAADFQRKTYAQPQIKVVEIESAELLSGSGDGASTQSLDEEEFDWNK